MQPESQLAGGTIDGTTTLRLSASVPNLRNTGSGAATPSGDRRSDARQTGEGDRASRGRVDQFMALSQGGLSVAQRASGRASSQALAAGQRPRQRLVSAVGSGCFHFWSDPDDDFGNARHEASETRKWEQRRKLRAAMDERAKQAFNPTYGNQDAVNGRSTYDINGKVFEYGKRTVPPPEQVNRAHWLCQVNGMTGKYNIINNTFENPIVTKTRDAQLATLRTMKEEHPMAGDVQPQRPVACYEMKSFVPIKERSYLGVRERHHTLFS